MSRESRGGCSGEREESGQQKQPWEHEMGVEEAREGLAGDIYRSMLRSESVAGQCGGEKRGPPDMYDLTWKPFMNNPTLL